MKRAEWRFHGYLLGLLCMVAAGACGDDDSATDLNEAGPPMVRQVFVVEKELVGTRDLVRTGLAFGDHPQIDAEDDNRTVSRAVAFGDGTQRIRIVLDELVEGNTIEEVGCVDGSFSRVPDGADPDDIANCAGAEELVAQRCRGEHAVCICEDPDAPCASSTGLGMPIGVLDENDDGAADEFRMIDFSGDNCDDPTIAGSTDGSSRQLAAQIVCDGVEIPLDCADSFYNPSGNQQIPAGPIGINGLGPALVLVPTIGLRTNSTCGLSFRSEVVDKDGNGVCAPPDGDPSQSCTPGDSTLIQFTVEPLDLDTSSPRDGAMNVALTTGGSGDAILQLVFNASIDAATVSSITLNDGNSDVAVTRTVVGDQRTVNLTVTGGLTANTTYTITYGTGLADLLGGTLPQAGTITFTSAASFATAAPK